jgi:hypothetical protein
MSMAMVWRFVVLFAVLLMPFGMQPAAAAPVMHHHASMPTQHCPDQDSRHGSKGAFAECTMVCSAALPAADLARDEPSLIVCAPAEAQAVRQLHGLHPDIATPPPKRS